MDGRGKTVRMRAGEECIFAPSEDFKYSGFRVFSHYKLQ